MPFPSHGLEENEKEETFMDSGTVESSVGVYVTRDNTGEVLGVSPEINILRKKFRSEECYCHHEYVEVAASLCPLSGYRHRWDGVKTKWLYVYCLYHDWEGGPEPENAKVELFDTENAAQKRLQVIKDAVKGQNNDHYMQVMEVPFYPKPGSK